MLLTQLKKMGLKYLQNDSTIVFSALTLRGGAFGLKIPTTGILNITQRTRPNLR